MGVEMDEVSFFLSFFHSSPLFPPQPFATICSPHQQASAKTTASLPLFAQDELKNELEELEQETLNDRLMGAERAPVHSPAPAGRVASYAEERESESYYPVLDLAVSSRSRV